MLMKSKVLTLIAMPLALTSVLTACGKAGSEKNPLNGYQSVNTAVVPHNQVVQDQFHPSDVFDIKAIGDLDYVQGQESKRDLMVRVSVTAGKQTQFTLRAEDLPEGASLTKDARTGFFSLKWRPAANILGLETSKLIPVKFQITPSKGPKPLPTTLNLTVKKDSAQPSLSETITFRPSQTVKSNQTVSVSVDVTSGGVRSADDIQVSPIRGPAKVARELVQMDGVIAVVENPTLVASKMVNSSTAKVTYQFKFETSRFTEAVMKQIEADPVLKKRYAEGTLKTAEASFNVQARNQYNGALSVERNVLVNVELPTPSGVAK